MLVANTKEELIAYLKKAREKRGSVGFVPTMGALHKGHQTLVEKCKEENNYIVVSIFVNPIQFQSNKDFEQYPTVIEKDLEILRELTVDLVFIPSVEEIFRENEEIKIQLPMMSKLEGKYRPNHFEGVACIVIKLLNLVTPQRAYFGRKDFQQYVIVKQLIQTLDVPTQIIGVPTVRELSGLAMSSRNQRLSEEGKKNASKIYKGLLLAKKLVLEQKGYTGVTEKVECFYRQLEGLEIEYFDIVNPQTLDSLVGLSHQQECVCCFAGYLEDVRMIDNIYFRID